ncbi:hypothetical protein IQ260_29210 [Leptolyngbya cf. ectocarpi LEGE 11479]|uniref:Uncharacterized protein n=1 Tax=Leptolyngbya cf. ectocarpi LEGE 11479 TaxID=1828722 RepID=A0A929A051_LEPEC|nr:DUF6544 family protein [Leptolyngbya ectocarpi]MBE9070724.1 hypothetical protein [Leptolyngbya cf. ectocarpi LEGE 11479]
MGFQPISVNKLWHSVSLSETVFHHDQIVDLPEPVGRYLKHAISAATPLASAVRLRMHGEIKLKQWQPFQAEQVIYPQRGMIWQAITRVNRLPVRGWDRLIYGKGAMQWKLLGLFPVMTAAGGDVTRSAIGRMHGECMWLPSMLSKAEWTVCDRYHIQATLRSLGNMTVLKLTIDDLGRLQQLSFKRWGNPDSSRYQFEDFGAYIDQESTFAGYTIPTKLRAGWYFGTHQFETEGEFFRVAIDNAIYK